MPRIFREKPEASSPPRTTSKLHSSRSKLERKQDTVAKVDEDVGPYEAKLVNEAVSSVQTQIDEALSEVAKRGDDAVIITAVAGVRVPATLMPDLPERQLNKKQRRVLRQAATRFALHMAAQLGSKSDFISIAVFLDGIWYRYQTPSQAPFV